jgi:hypothetical protein
MINRMFWLLVVALWCAASVMGQGPANDPGIRDTLYVASVQVDAGQQAVVPVTFVNDEELGGLTIPLAWTSPDISLDSVSFVGSRIDYIGTKPLTIHNDQQNVVFGAVVILEEYIQPGSGLMATLYFNVPPGAPDQFVYIDSALVGPAYLLFTLPDSRNFTPEFFQGRIQIGESVPPHIEISPTSMTFEGTVGYPSPPSQALTISNGGGGTLDWTASTVSSWLSVNPSSGTAPSVTAVKANHTGLPEGTYYDTVVIAAAGADNSPRKLPVQLNVISLPPQIVVSPTSFTVSAVQGGANPADRILHITNPQVGSVLNWTVTNTAGWLSLSPTSGSPPDSVTLSFDITGLSYGLYYDTVVVSDPAATNSPQSVPVTLQIVSNLPVLELDPDTLHVVALLGQSPDPKFFMVSNSGEGLLTYTATEASKYITGLSPASGSAPQAVQVSFNTIELGLGDYYTAITVASPEAINSPQVLSVHFHISSNPARFALIPNSIQFSIYECWQGPNALPPIRTLQVENTGGDVMNWWLTHTADWLLLSDSSGQNDDFIHLRPADTAQWFPVGVYYDTLVFYSVNAINSPQIVPVTLSVNAGDEDPEIVLQSTIVNIPVQEVFGTTQGLAAVTRIYNQNPGCMDYWIEEDIPWLRFIDSMGNAPAIPRVALDVGTYTWGVYPDSFYVYSSTATNSPVKGFVNMLVWRLHGDVNWDNTINMIDVVYLIDYIFRSGPAPQPEYLVGDCNCDSRVNIEDAVYLIDYIFKSGDEPCGNP